MNFVVQYLIFTMITSAFATAKAIISRKYKKKILFLQKIVKTFLLLEPSITLLFNFDIFNKAYFLANVFSKMTKRWNQANYKYIHPYFGMAFGKSKTVLVKKKFITKT